MNAPPHPTPAGSDPDGPVPPTGDQPSPGGPAYHGVTAHPTGQETPAGSWFTKPAESAGPGAAGHGTVPGDSAAARYSGPETPAGPGYGGAAESAGQELGPPERPAEPWPAAPGPEYEPPARPLNRPVRSLLAVLEVLLAAGFGLLAAWAWDRASVPTRLPDYENAAIPDFVSRQSGPWTAAAVGAGLLAALFLLDAVRQVGLAIRATERPQARDHHGHGDHGHGHGGHDHDEAQAAEVDARDRRPGGDQPG